jgi:hypothetical protein
MKLLIILADTLKIRLNTLKLEHTFVKHKDWLNHATLYLSEIKSTAFFSQYMFP